MDGLANGRTKLSIPVLIRVRDYRQADIVAELVDAYPLSASEND